MRIVLNTRSDNAGTRVCIYDLAERLAQAGVDVAVNDWSGYAGADAVVFMGYDHELEVARAVNAGIKIVLADPKLSQPEWVAAARAADLLLVSSVEQRDSFLPLNRNILVHHMFPAMEARPREHGESRPLVLGYHGNRTHLESMARGAAAAIEELGRTREVELLAIYDVAGLGRATVGLPDERVVAVTHVQWTPQFADSLVRADIGLVPNELPLRDRHDALEATALDLPQLAYESFDHLLRFKSSTNAGRLQPFARLGIPVVADFAPSIAEFVVDRTSGMLGSSAHGWFDALDRLASSPPLRTRLAAALDDRIQAVVAGQVDRLLAALGTPPLPGPPDLGDDDEEARRRLGRYRRPGAPVRARIARRLRRAAG